VSTLGVISRKIRAALELPSNAAVPLVNVVIAEDLTEPQNNSQFDERLAAGRINQGAVAAEFAHAQIFNPAGSGVLVVVEQIWGGANTANVAQVSRFDTVLAGTAGDPDHKGFRDTRVSGSPVATINSDSDGSQLGVIILFSPEVIATETTFLDFPFILAPGTGLMWGSGTVNVSLQFTAIWKELALPNV